MFMPDVNDNLDAISLREFFESFSCIQHADVSTHTHGHTLDLIISRSSDDLVVGKPLTDSLVSDHMSVMCLLNVQKPPVNVKKVVCHQITSIDLETFQNDLKVSDLVANTCTSDSLNELVTFYENTMSSIVDKYAPLVTKYVNLSEAQNALVQ